MLIHIDFNKDLWDQPNYRKSAIDKEMIDDRRNLCKITDFHSSLQNHFLNDLLLAKLNRNA